MAGSDPVPPSPAPELVIVGGGPVGLYACYYGGFRGLETVVLESLHATGGQISAFYPDAEIFDVPGFPRVRGRELTSALERQATQFGAEIRSGRRVRRIEQDGDELRVESTLGTTGDAPIESIRTRAVLLTIGVGPFAPQRVKDAAIDRFDGHGLAYDEPELDRVRGRRVMVLGGSSEAVARARALSEVAAATYLVHRRDRLPAREDGTEALAGSSVEFLPFRELEALEGETDVRAAVLTDRRSGEHERVEIDLVLPRFGYAAKGEALRGLGAGDDGTIAVDSSMATAIPGVFAAGDVAVYPGKVKVLAAAFGEACTAVNNIAHRIIPGAGVFPGYSSHSGGAPRRPKR
jgi:ferredoxin/flavodoxin---NADP+ reductase